MNRNYCRVIDEGAAFEYAPSFFAPNPATPTEAEYLAHGWLKNRIVDATPAEGYMVTGTRYEAQGDGVVAVYEYAPIPAPVRRFSVAKIIYFVTERGTYDSLKDALGESMMMQAVALGEFTEDNEDFVEIRPAVEAAFGADVVAAALDYAAEED